MRCSILQENLEPIRRNFGSRYRISLRIRGRSLQPIDNNDCGSVAFYRGSELDLRRQKGSRSKSRSQVSGPTVTRSQILKIFGVSLRAQRSKDEDTLSEQPPSLADGGPRRWGGQTEGACILAASAPERSTTWWRCTSRASKKKKLDKKNMRGKKGGTKLKGPGITVLSIILELGWNLDENSRRWSWTMGCGCP